MPIPFVTAWWEAVMQRLQAWRERRERAEEFRSIGPHDTERLLRDVDLHMSDMPVVLQGSPGRAELLDRRLTALRLDPTYLEVSDRELYRDLQRACLRCTSWRRCARDLARDNVQAGLESYCPNGHAIDQFLVGETEASRRSNPPAA